MNKVLYLLTMIREIFYAVGVLIIIYIIWNYTNPLIFDQILIYVGDKVFNTIGLSGDELEKWEFYKTLIKWVLDLGLFIILFGLTQWIYRRATRKEPNETPSVPPM
jgi:uncharacterized membrane protein